MENKQHVNSMMQRILIGLVLMLLWVPQPVRAYGTETHAALTREVVQFYNQTATVPLTDAEISLLMDGAVREDDAPRFLNHFYDPVSGAGLSMFGRAWVPAARWAESPEEQLAVAYNWQGAVQGAAGMGAILRPSQLAASDFTWQRSLIEYAHGDKERALRGLGQVLHLLEDMTVPAHTRNDPHPPKETFGEELGDNDPYETWSHLFTRENTVLANTLTGQQPARFSSLREYFDSLAGHTNAHFYSDDSIGAYERPASVVQHRRVIGSREYQIARDASGEYPIAAVKSRAPGLLIRDELLTTESELVSQATWQRLTPRLVRHGAGVVALFLDQAEQVRITTAPPDDRSDVRRVLDSGIAAARTTVHSLSSAAKKLTNVVSRALARQGDNSAFTATAFVEHEGAATEEHVAEPEEVAVIPVSIEQPAPPVPSPVLIAESPAPIIPAALPPPVIAPRLFDSSAGATPGPPPPVVLPPTLADTPISAPTVLAPSPVAPSDPVTPLDLPVEELPTPPPLRANIRISEVLVDLPGADSGEFIELYNPNHDPVSLSGWSVQYLSPTATSTEKISKKNFSEDARIPAKGFYLIGTGDYEGSAIADMRWNQSLGNAGGSILILATTTIATGVDDAQIVDGLAYGSGTLPLVGSSPVSLPPVGVSLERYATDETGACISPQDTGEFLGNGCAPRGPSQFNERMVPAPQNTQSLPEPRRAPAWGSPPEFARYDARAPSSAFTPQITFDWPEAAGATRYLLAEVATSTTILAAPTSTRSFAKNIREIGREYVFTLQAVDADGYASEPVRQELVVPGYFDAVTWHRDGDAKAPNGSDQYVINFEFSQYPFVPIRFGNLPGFHLVLPYYNHPPDPVPNFDSSMDGRIWASFGNPYGIKNDYWSCSGDPGQSIVFVELREKCNSLAGGVVGLAYNWDTLAEWDFKKAVVYVWGSSFKTPPVAGQDYLSFAFYGTPGSSNLGMKYIATDVTKYYISNPPVTDSASTTPAIEEY